MNTANREDAPCPTTHTLQAARSLSPAYACPRWENETETAAPRATGGRRKGTERGIVARWYEVLLLSLFGKVCHVVCC